MASEARYPILAELGLEWPEDTPMDTVTATDTTQFESVSGSHVVETGSLGARPRGDSPTRGAHRADQKKYGTYNSMSYNSMSYTIGNYMPMTN